MRRVSLVRAVVQGRLAKDEDEALLLIAEHRVTVDGAIALSPQRLVAPHENIDLIASSLYVSRGGEKLAHAIDRFALRVEGKRAIDIGSSTGGFTDCLLQHGASSVTALDTGRNLLHERLRVDPRVEVREGVNVRTLNTTVLGAPFALVVVDVSFISLQAIAGVLASLVHDEGDVVALVKPQFEARRAEADRGEGVIRDSAIHDRVLGEVRDALALVGLGTLAVERSPITGHQGNVEFLLHARPVKTQ